MSSANYGDPQSWNRYTYVFNNPLKYIDPTGNFSAPASDGGGYYVKKSDSVQHPEWFNENPGDDYELIVTYVWHSVESGKYYAANPFQPEVRAFDNLQDAQAAYQGYVINEALGDAPRMPDGVQISAGALILGGTATLDAYGNWYLCLPDVYLRQPTRSGYVGNWVPRPNIRAGISLNFVWIDQFETPTEEESVEAFTGPSVTFQGGKIIGGQYTIGSRNIVGIGLTTPGAGVVAAPNTVKMRVERFPFSWR